MTVHPCSTAFTYPSEKTFRQAAESYISNGHESRYLDKIMPHLGDMPLAAIYPYDVRELAKTLYPAHSNSTRNRCVITPIRAVLYHGYDRGWGPQSRLRNLKEEQPKRKKAASQTWLHDFFRQCDRDGAPHIAALVMFMSQTGARVSEALRLAWPDVDLAAKTAVLLRTKTSTYSVRHLSDQMIARFYALRQSAQRPTTVFRLTDRSHVNVRIREICGRADIPYKPSHTCGRHSFATNAIALGNDIKTTMEAGGWKSVAVFLGTYVNPRHAGRKVAESFNLQHCDSES
ncbi:tyrosine-type recombinase/integrase [Rhizobium oryzicola]|uniref:Tyrosine-type recombinase/integrase n=1 Tax=Rhizobium oryzicola TaxID=1232668 RepID=A0ABT8SVC8_9HYPH|nr:tyrosine-type recombinase/integrase [Rhizobium oryzicola]MDO1582392.1 tyrosine-type recombinase/integrase [Rhizobium oryzicola]